MSARAAAVRPARSTEGRSQEERPGEARPRRETTATPGPALPTQAGSFSHGPRGVNRWRLRTEGSEPVFYAKETPPPERRPRTARQLRPNPPLWVLPGAGLRTRSANTARASYVRSNIKRGVSDGILVARPAIRLPMDGQATDDRAGGDSVAGPRDRCQHDDLQPGQRALPATGSRRGAEPCAGGLYRRRAQPGPGGHVAPQLEGPARARGRLRGGDGLRLRHLWCLLWRGAPPGLWVDGVGQLLQRPRGRSAAWSLLHPRGGRHSRHPPGGGAVARFLDPPTGGGRRHRGAGPDDQRPGLYGGRSRPGRVPRHRYRARAGALRPDDDEPGHPARRRHQLVRGASGALSQCPGTPRTRQGRGSGQGSATDPRSTARSRVSQRQQGSDLRRRAPQPGRHQPQPAGHRRPQHHRPDGDRRPGAADRLCQRGQPAAGTGQRATP